MLLPVFNEIYGLTEIIPKINQSDFEEVIILDGGSTDKSLEFAYANSIRVIHQTRKGLGAAVFDAMHQINTEYVIEFSPDGNCMVEHLPIILEKLSEGNDLVVVSRYKDEARSYDDSKITAFGNHLFSKLINVLSKYPLTDTLTIYRGFRIDLVDDPMFEKLLYGPVFEPLTSAIAAIRKYKVIEIPGDEPARIGGERKMRVIYNGSCILLMIIRLYILKFKLILGLSKHCDTRT